MSLCGSSHFVSYEGGKTIAHIKVVSIFVYSGSPTKGDPTDWAGNTADFPCRINDFLYDFLRSSYLEKISADTRSKLPCFPGVGTGSLLATGRIFLNGIQSSGILWPDKLEPLAAAQLVDTGKVPAPTDDILYLFFLPMSLSTMTTRVGFAGYHKPAAGSLKKTQLAAVGFNGEIVVKQPGLLDAFSDLTYSASHQIIASATDPDEHNPGVVYNPAHIAEDLADPCLAEMVLDNHPPPALFHGFVVSRYQSASTGTCLQAPEDNHRFPGRGVEITQKNPSGCAKADSGAMTFIAQAFGFPEIPEPTFTWAAFVEPEFLGEKPFATGKGPIFSVVAPTSMPIHVFVLARDAMDCSVGRGITAVSKAVNAFEREQCEGNMIAAGGLIRGAGDGPAIPKIGIGPPRINPGPPGPYVGSVSRAPTSPSWQRVLGALESSETPGWQSLLKHLER